MSYKATIAILTSLVLSFTKASATEVQSAPINLNGGLQAQVLSVGRDKTLHHLTASMTLQNKGKNTIYLLLLFGPGNPSADDNTGAGFNYQGSSGVPVCPAFGSIPSCIGVPDIIRGQTPPLQSWMEIDPDTSAALNFQLYTGQESHGPLASFSCTFAYRVVSDPVRDDTLTEEQKRQRIHVMNLSFPSTTISQEQ